MIIPPNMTALTTNKDRTIIKQVLTPDDILDVTWLAYTVEMPHTIPVAVHNNTMTPWTPTDVSFDNFYQRHFNQLVVFVLDKPILNYEYKHNACLPTTADSSTLSFAECNARLIADYRLAISKLSGSPTNNRLLILSVAFIVATCGIVLFRYTT